MTHWSPKTNLENPLLSADISISTYPWTSLLSLSPHSTQGSEAPESPHQRNGRVEGEETVVDIVGHSFE